MVKKLSVLVCLSLLSSFTFAKEENNKIIESIDAFVKCDSSFFSYLNKNQNAFNNLLDTKIISENNVAYIPVEDIEDSEEYTIYFNQPIEYKDLNIVGYQDFYFLTAGLGSYYYWGFIINNPVAEVATRLNNINWLKNSETSYIHDAKIYDLTNDAAKWQDNPYSIDKMIPRYNTVEKSLYLEPLSDTQSRIICSIQGDLKDDLLYTIRPDLKIRLEPVKTESEVKVENKVAQENI